MTYKVTRHHIYLCIH